MPPTSTATATKPPARPAAATTQGIRGSAPQFVAGPLESDALVELFLVPPEPAGPAAIREGDAKAATSAHGEEPGAVAPEVVVRAAMNISSVSDEGARGGVPATAAAPSGGPAEARAVGRPGSMLGCLRGVHGLGVECPYAPDVELGVDAEGTVHVAAWMGRDADARAVGDVLIAARWAKEHAALLAKVALAADLVNSERGPARGEAVAHLITDDAARLRWLGDCGIRLHLAVRAGGGWTAVRL